MLLEILTTWTSLEIVKLVVSGATPVLVVVAGLFLNRILKKFEHRQWRNQKLIEKQLAIYDELAPKLNDVLCYYTYVGNWKEQTPVDIIVLKRKIDKEVYLAKPLFSSDFFMACTHFSHLCYQTFSGMGEDAKLCTDFRDRKKVFGAKWNTDWELMFRPGKCPTDKQVREAYDAIMDSFSREIGLRETKPASA